MLDTEAGVATNDAGDVDPRAHHAAAELGAGRLLPEWQADQLATGAGRSRAVVQRTLLGDHPTRRARAVDEQWQALGWRARRRADPAELAAGYDDTHLLVCDLCAVAVPRHGEYDDGLDVGADCPACWRGHLITYRQRGQVPALADRLTTIRDRLAGAAR